MSVTTVPYVYVDHRSNAADALFNQYGIKVARGEEMVRAGSPYSIVFCRVKKRDAKKFEMALRKLKDKLLLIGHRDYVDACSEVAGLFEREGENVESKYNYDQEM